MSISRHWLIVCLILSILTFFGCISFLKANLNQDESIKPQLSANQPLSSFHISLPIDCKLGESCFIFHYVDIEPNLEAIDFNCGRQTYNDHTGTDFGITNLKEMEKGVSVIAVASGKVKRIRDGIIDKLVVDQSDKNAVTNRECGNGVVIDHGQGWETQYCHLKQGSVLVKPNDQVEKETPLGLVGASGLASFPHVHLTVRYQEQVIDPFIGQKAISGCQTTKKSLWESQIAYQPTGLINAGFATKPPTSLELWQGNFLENKFSLKTPALVFWVHLYGIIKGDIESFTLINPKGQVVIQQDRPVAKSYRNWVSYIGQKSNPESPILMGIWKGKYQLKRNSQIIFELNREVEIKS